MLPPEWSPCLYILGFGVAGFAHSRKGRQGSGIPGEGRRRSPSGRRKQRKGRGAIGTGSEAAGAPSLVRGGVGRGGARASRDQGRFHLMRSVSNGIGIGSHHRWIGRLGSLGSIRMESVFIFIFISKIKHLNFILKQSFLILSFGHFFLNTLIFIFVE